MTPDGPTVRLVERRSVVRRLPRADVADLLARFRHVVEVTPILEVGRFRLTARCWVGTFRTANRTWEIRPKVGWERVGLLISNTASVRSAAGSDETNGPAGLLSLFAGRLAELMTERARAGLVRGYVERAEVSSTVRGRIDFPELARRSHPSMDRLPQVVDEFTADVPWNRYPLSVARRLIAQPGLSSDARTALATATDGFTQVSDGHSTTPALPPDPRLVPYRTLFEWCRLIFATFGAGPGDNTPFLVNLEHLFQTHVTSLLLDHPRTSRKGVVRPQLSVRLMPTALGATEIELLPDLVVSGPTGEPRSVWDAKWKPLPPTGPDPADVHQVLGYAAAVGAGVAGLIYPGRRFAVHEYATPDGRVWLRVVTMRTAGTPDQLRRSAARLVRTVFAGTGGA